MVFEPNDEPLWSQIRLNVGAFLQGLFLQGAFQGSTPQQAYFVKCDAENNPQSLIDQGIPLPALEKAFMKFFQDRGDRVRNSGGGGKGSVAHT